MDAPRRVDDHRRRPLALGERQARLGPEDEGRLGEDLGGDRRRREDGDLLAGARRLAGARVEEVVVADAVHLEPALVISARREGGVRDLDEPEDVVPRRAGRGGRRATGARRGAGGVEVTNNAGSTVSAIDTATLQVVRTFTVPAGSPKVVATFGDAEGCSRPVH